MPLTNLAMSIPQESCPHFKFQIQPPPNTVQPSQEVKLLLAVDCLRPYVECPDMDVAFSHNNRPHLYALRLPIAPSQFFEAAPCDKPTYMTRWNGLGAECEQQEVFPCFKAIDPVFMGQVRKNLTSVLKVGLAADLDIEGGLTVTACCSFRTGTIGPDGGAICVGAMLRLEADTAGQRFRITVRCKNASVGEAVKNAFKQQLGAK